MRRKQNPAASAFEARRRIMVERDIAGRGVRDAAVLEAMGKVPRELFVPEHLVKHAYADRPLPIGAGQTISQPYIVAFMIEALGLKGGETVLEVGAGSAYAAAVLGRIAGRVIAIERIGELAEFARRNLERAGCGNVLLLHADGSEGARGYAPFGAILVSACAARLPEELLAELEIGGTMVVPVGQPSGHQRLVRVVRSGESDYRQEQLAHVSFVPLIEGAGGDGEMLRLDG